MSERQAWRPNTAPKPAVSTSTSDDKQHAAALRGAALAFSSPQTVASPAAVDTRSPGALSAARAGHGRGDPNNGRSSSRGGISPARGRSQLTLDLQKATDNLQRESYRADSARPRTLQRTVSEIAARAASANASPTRGITGLHLSQSPVRSSQSGSQDTRSREASVVSRGRPGPDPDVQEALAGANASMSPSPPHQNSPFSTGTGKLDLTKIPSLVATPSSPDPISKQHLATASLSAARSASKGAEARASANNRQTSPMPPPRHAETDPMAIKSPPEPSKPSSQQPPQPRKDPLTVPVQQPQTRSDIHETTKPSHHKERSNTQDSGLASPRDKPNTVESQPKPLPATKPITIPSRAKQSSGHAFSPASASPSTRTPQSPYHKGMTASTLADAMVSASLASRHIPQSRDSTPPKRKHAPPAPPPTRHRRSSSANAVPTYRHAPAPPPRMKPLPTKPMRSTLRKHSPDSSTKEEKRGRKHHLRKHPNMHHEGDRKRWRDKLTDRERKRYEGVWAANKGLLLEYDEAPTSFPTRLASRDVPREETVLNIVVRDIWDRSRLPRDVLEEVWDLVVEGEDVRCLNRSQFVVGLWLIDLRLKGRKLPTKVSDSVWASVRHTTGVKVRSKVMA